MTDNLHIIPCAYLIPLPIETFSRSIRLGPGVITIGRSRSNTIYLAHGSAFRNHARISLIDGQYVLSDLKLRNSTYVNKKRIKNIPLKHNDQIVLGDRSFVFLLRDPEHDDSDLVYTSSEDTVCFQEDDIHLPDMVVRKAETAARTFLDPNLTKWVMDESGLKRALLNLVVNANDAVKEKDNGIITISTFIDEKNHLNIGVSDNGCGIEPGRINNVFQLFFTTKGTGLGLPMVQRLVERLGGTISVESKADEGATFNLNIPWIEDN